jgi:VWFA-related protein
VVVDGRGRPVRGLDKENFRIYEDGRLQPTAVFHHGDSSVTLGLVVDRSQSMRPKTQALAAAVSSLLQSTGPEDELFAVDFNDQVSLALPSGRSFTNDARELATAVAAVVAQGATALYDGVAAGLEHLARGRAQRRALIVLSDGGDNGSIRTYGEVLAAARRSDAVIYGIGLLRSGPNEEQENPELLKRLCRDTGGVAYFPKTDAEIAMAAAQVASDLHEQYTLGFVPAERTDKGAFRKIEVTATMAGHGRLRVRTRTGYVVTDTGGEGGRP